MSEHCRRLTLGLAVLVIAACAEASSPTAVNDAVVHLEGANVQRSPADRNFLELSRSINRGESDGDGACVLSGSETAKIGAGTVVDKVVEIDLATCAYVMARGNWVAPEALTDITSKSAVISASAEKTLSASRGPPSPSLTGSAYYHANQKLWYYDPLAIHVTEDQTFVDYSLAGDCIGYSQGVHSVRWFTQSGWEEPWSSGANDDLFCDFVRYESYSYYNNHNWCYPGVHHTEYPVNRVEVWAIGNVNFLWRARAYGDCPNSLWFNRSRQT
jgi:hypothetical protein